MMDQAIVRGVEGQIRWAYYVAAGVEGWTAVRDPRGGRPKSAPIGWRLTARVVGSDAYKMSQRPLLFLVTHQKGRWVWPIETFTIVNGTLSAKLGPVEEYRA